MKKALLCSFIFITLVFTTTFCSIEASATSKPIKQFALWDKLDPEQQDLFSQNNVIFYDPTECTEPNSDDSTAGLLSGKDNLEKIWNYLVKANINGVSNDPKVISGILGNLYVESSYNPFATNGTYYGIYQTDRREMISKVNSEVGSHWGSTVEGEKNDKALEIELNDMVKENSRFNDFVKDLSKVQNKTPSSYAELFMLHVERCVYGDYSIKDSGVVKAMHDLYNGKTYYYQAGQKRCDEAEKIYKKYGNGSTTASTGTDTATSSDSSSSVSSDGSTVDNAGQSINDTALKLAYPGTSGHDRLKPSSEYQKALKERGADKSSDACAKIGNSCDMFVSTVLYVSGVDKEMPLGAVDSQNKHLKEHPELYEKIENWTPATAQPGDIQIRKDEGHIRIIVKDDNDFKIADASHCDHTAEVKALDSSSGQFDVYRARGGAIKKDECTNSSSGNMDLNKTAIDLAWPKGEKHGAKDPKPAYVQAMDEVYGKNRGSCEQYGANCAMFVATVVRYSGADPGYGESSGGKHYDGWAYSQGLYMLDHPELYEDVTEGYGKDTMRAGDIQVMKGNGWDNRSRPNIGAGQINHVRMVIQYTDGKFYIAEASQCSRTAEINGSEYNGNISKHTKVFRLKSSVQSSPTITADPSKSNGSMSIGKTALELAWPKGTACTSKSTPEYYKARMAVGISTDKTIDHSKKYACAGIGASCDRFVGVVIRYSGVDPKAGKWVCDENNSDQNCIIGRALANPDIYQEVTEGYSTENARDGDILLRSGHAWVIAQLPNGKLHRVEASYTQCCTGRVTGEFKWKPTESGQKVRVFRAKNQTSSNTNCCKTDGEEEGSDGGTGQLKDGGFKTAKEADNAIIKAYKSASNSELAKHGVCASCASGCTNSGAGGRYNCSAFSVYFVNKYTTVKGKAVQKNGNATVSHLINEKGFKNGHHTPQVYAVFSQNASACGIGSSNHTGVILGIDKANDKAIIGEAACSGGYARAKEVSLSCMSKAPFTYAYPPGLKGLKTP